MRPFTFLFALLVMLPLRAERNADWTTPVKPFQIADNLYYVGTRDLASYLITTPSGNILINANLVSSPPQIRASIERLGFHFADTKILLNSQAHFDHVAGAAEILRLTHASNMVMEGDDKVIASGGRADFAFGDDITTTYPPTPVNRILHDGSAITLGDPAHGGATIIAHKTAGHTRGCTTFTLRSHIPGEPVGQLRTIVIVGGASALPHYRLIAVSGKPASYPGIAEDFEHSFALLRALPCDVFLGAHGIYFNLLPKLARLPKEGPIVFVDPTGYQSFVAEQQAEFEKTLAAQQAATH